jgi:hypothetical protein
VKVARIIVGIALASALATTASAPAWGHTFPSVRDVVVQVERCEVALLVGYRPRSGEDTDAILARAGSAPKSQGLDALRDLLAQHALAPLSIRVDGTPLVPTNVRAKVGVEPGGARPMIVLLVTYALAPGRALSVATREPRSTRISWQDRDSGRVEIAGAPSQGKWHTGVASLLLTLSAPPGEPACASPPSIPSSPSSSRRAR